MNKVKVGELRNHLSKYLKKVRQGAEIVITDRDTPIGRLSPFRERDDELFELIPSSKSFADVAKLDFPDIPCTVDPVELLIEDRRRR